MKIKNLQTRATKLVSVDEESRTVELIWTTGADEIRSTWGGDRYVERLVVTPAAVDLRRLKSGAPFLDGHSGYSASQVRGVVEDASVSDGKGYAKVRFDTAENDPLAEQLFRKIADKIVTGNSVGYRILKAKRTKEEIDGIPVVLITRWEPVELSAVPMPVDIGAKFRGMKDEIMEPEVEETGSAVVPAVVPVAEPVVEQRNIETDIAAAINAERVRSVEVRRLGKLASIPHDQVEQLVSSGATVEAARSMAIDAMAARDAARPVVKSGADLEGKRHELRGVALLHRVDSSRHKLTDEAREYRGLSLIELASNCLADQGVNTRGMSKMEIAKAALQTRGHSTADFPLLLADTGNKTLRDGYTEAPQTFEPFVKRTKAPDFKDLKRTALGAFPGLVAKPEGAPYQGATMSEAREVYHVETFGRKIQFTREAMVNDDLEAFSSILPRMGAAAKRKESDNVYSIFTTNAAMSDTVALFHATHANLGSGVPSAASIGAAFLAMRKQTGLASELLDLAPKVMLVPGALEFLALQLKATLPGLGVSSNSNPYAGRYDVVVEPRLDATSALVWYMTADKAQIDMIEFATLEGQDAPVMESETDFDTDGLTMKVRWEFGVKAIDWRGLYKSTGA